MFDLVIRNGSLVTPERDRQRRHRDRRRAYRRHCRPNCPAASVKSTPPVSPSCPALIDIHLHFNEPGRADWEGAATGSRALAAGGGTLFFDMPLNSSPCTVNAREFDRKRRALEAASITDFALWGGLIPGNLDELDGTRGTRRGRFQSVPVRFRPAGISARRRSHALRRHAASRAPRPPRRGPRRKRRDHQSSGQRRIAAAGRSRHRGIPRIPPRHRRSRSDHPRRPSRARNRMQTAHRPHQLRQRRCRRARSALARRRYLARNLPALSALHRRRSPAHRRCRQMRAAFARARSNRRRSGTAANGGEWTHRARTTRPVRPP